VDHRPLIIPARLRKLLLARDKAITHAEKCNSDSSVGIRQPIRLRDFTAIVRGIPVKKASIFAVVSLGENRVYTPYRIDG